VGPGVRRDNGGASFFCHHFASLQFNLSSLRTQGPITTGFHCFERSWLQRACSMTSAYGYGAHSRDPWACRGGHESRVRRLRLLAMISACPCGLAAQIASELLRRVALENREGAGKAGCPSHPWSACNRKHAAEPQVRTGSTGLPCAMVLTAYSALSSVNRAFLPPSSAKCISALRELSASVGAPGPHGLAVRVRAGRLPPHPRPPHPASTSVTTRSPLSLRRDDQKKPLIWDEQEAEYFFAQDWTREISLKGHAKFAFARS
jgi:hypothetical protein